MASYPNRCQHIKVNGTQCGSPALRRNKFCFFHKEWREQRVSLNANRARRARTITLPVLEDANSIQVALMQVMRLIVSKEIDSRTAGLLLYALQTASVNLRNTRFEPRSMHEVVLDPRAAADTPLGQNQLWSDEDFQAEDDEEEEEAAPPPPRFVLRPREDREQIEQSEDYEDDYEQDTEQAENSAIEAAGEAEDGPGKKPSMPDMSKVRQELSDIVVARAPEMLAPLTDYQRRRLQEVGMPTYQYPGEPKGPRIKRR